MHCHCRSHSLYLRLGTLIRLEIHEIVPSISIGNSYFSIIFFSEKGVPFYREALGEVDLNRIEGCHQFYNGLSKGFECVDVALFRVYMRVIQEVLKGGNRGAHE